MMELLHELDTNLFLYLNGKHSAAWDVAMTWISSRYFWIPLYLFLVVFTAVRFRRKSILIVLFAVALVVVSDQLSVHGFKEVFLRLRPCHEPALAGLVHAVDGCGGQYGFVSSHAANVFALSAFLVFVYRGRVRYFAPLILTWALVVSCSRIYLGKHYPLDVLGGMALGITLAWLMAKIYVLAKRKLSAGKKNPI